MVHLSDGKWQNLGEGNAARERDERLAGAVLTSAGEVMLYLGFLAASIVLSDGGRLPMPELEGGWGLLGIASLGLVVSIGASRGNKEGGVVANWGANLSLVATVVMIGRLLQSMSRFSDSIREVPFPDLTPFLAGSIIVVLVHTLIVNGRLLYAQVRNRSGLLREELPAALPARWGLTIVLLLPLL